MSSKEHRTAAPVVHVAQLAWAPDEAATPEEKGQAVVAHGYELTVRLKLDDEGKPTRRWLWTTRMTSEISETPEILDVGEAASESGAKRAAANPVNAALRDQFARDRKTDRDAAAKQRKAAKAKAKAAKAKAARKGAD